jgi:hypothetical protein
MEDEDVVELVLPRVEAVRRLLVHVHLQLHLYLLSCTEVTGYFSLLYKAMLRIRIRIRIRMFLDRLDPNPSDPNVFGPPGSESGSISQRFRSGSESFYHQAKILRKTLIPAAL